LNYIYSYDFININVEFLAGLPINCGTVAFVFFPWFQKKTPQELRFNS